MRSEGFWFALSVLFPKLCATSDPRPPLALGWRNPRWPESRALTRGSLGRTDLARARAHQAVIETAVTASPPRCLLWPSTTNTCGFLRSSQNAKRTTTDRQEPFGHKG